MELLKGAKRLQSNSDFINKYLILPSHPLHEKYITAKCIFSFVYICFITVGRSFIGKRRLPVTELLSNNEIPLN